MTTVNDDLIRAFLADEARRAVAAAPSLDEAVGRLAPRIERRPSGASQRLIILLAATLLLVAALGTAIAVGSGILRLPQVIDDPEVEPIRELGIFEPVAGRIVYYADSSLWAVDPAAPADPATRVQLTPEAGIPLGWSSDGTRLLIMRQSRGEEHLFVLHADGSETQVTERPMAIRGATISPDGSRVVFAGATETPEGDARWALYAVDTDGGPASMLIEARKGIVEDPTFSPDGTQIAYDDGAGDHSHSVWLMDADGSDAHQIVSNESTAGAGHVYGLAWSPAGDRIALGVGETTYTFATDGSDFTRVITGGFFPFWSPDASQLAYTIACLEDSNGCGLAIADADGTNIREFSFGTSGPWHPGTLQTGTGG